MEIGTKIVCIKSFRGVNKFGLLLSYKAPQEGEIFHYDGYASWDEIYRCHYIFLMEYLEPLPRPRFNAAHFRRVDDIHAEWTDQLTNELEQEMEEEYVGVEAL